MSKFIDIKILRKNLNFRYLFIGQFISFFGTMITGVALPYQIYHMTHSTLWVGLLSLSQLVPLLFTALFGGVLADRHHRKLLLISAESLLAIGCVLLALNAASATPKIWVLFIVASVMSAFNGLHRPALDSITQQIVDKKDYPAVGALKSFKTGVGMIAGPAVAGLLISHFGLLTTYTLDLMTFLISLVALLLMHHIPAPLKNNDESTLAALKTGLRYAVSKQHLMGSYLVDFSAMIFGMPLALFPAIAEQFGGASTLGLLYSSPAVGALIFSFISGWTIKVKRHGAAIAIAALLWGIAIIGFGFSKHLWLALLFLMFAGGFDAVSGIFRSILWNETIPSELRGRLAGIEMISYLSGPKLGDTESGLMAAAFGITFSVVSGGILCIVGIGLCCYFLPKFWKYQSTTE
ncbi:MAG: MFS transporter [Legionellales bacterium]|nr:MFS transporter [Legionellales bacterium]